MYPTLRLCSEKFRSHLVFPVMHESHSHTSLTLAGQRVATVELWNRCRAMKICACFEPKPATTLSTVDAPDETFGTLNKNCFLAKAVFSPIFSQLWPQRKPKKAAAIFVVVRKLHRREQLMQLFSLENLLELFPRRCHIFRRGAPLFFFLREAARLVGSRLVPSAWSAQPGSG